MVKNKRISQVELDTALALHEKWLSGEPNGVQANFSGMTLPLNLKGKNFRKAILRGAHLKKCSLHSADFTGADLYAADLDSAVGSKTSFCKATMTRVCLDNFECEDVVDFSEADLTSADLCGDFTAANFTKAILDDADFSGSCCARTVFRSASLRNAYIVWALFKNVDMSQADLSGTNCSGTDFSESIFQKTDFSGAYLCDTDLRNCDLRGATLSRAIMYGANTEGILFEQQ